MRAIFTSFLLSFLLVSCSGASVRHYRLEVVDQFPHDTESYTQGLFFHKGQMYETTGLNGKSTLRKVDINTGKPLKRIDFDKKYFVEGSVVFKDNLYIPFITFLNQLFKSCLTAEHTVNRHIIGRVVFMVGRCLKNRRKINNSSTE